MKGSIPSMKEDVIKEGIMPLNGADSNNSKSIRYIKESQSDVGMPYHYVPFTERNLTESVQPMTEDRL